MCTLYVKIQNKEVSQYLCFVNSFLSRLMFCQRFQIPNNFFVLRSTMNPYMDFLPDYSLAKLSTEF